MAKVVRVVISEDGMDFCNILSFKTENYAGFWEDNIEKFVLLKQCVENETCFTVEAEKCFKLCIINGDCDGLRELDDVVYSLVGEHITDVYDSITYHII